MISAAGYGAYGHLASRPDHVYERPIGATGSAVRTIRSAGKVGECFLLLGGGDSASTSEFEADRNKGTP
jgi:hypothetical protein